MADGDKCGILGNLEDIPPDFGESYLPYPTTLRQRQRAKAFSAGSYVSELKIYKNGDKTDVKSRVYRSQKKNESPHVVVMTVDPEKKQISDAYCSCKAGVSGECAHVLAVIMSITDWLLQGLKQVPAQLACTSLPQQWDKPRGQKILPEPVSTMVVARPGNVARKKRPLTAMFDDNRGIPLLPEDITKLQALQNCPLSYLACQPTSFVQTNQGPQAVGSALAYHIPLIHTVCPPGGDVECGDIDFPHSVTIELPPVVKDSKEKLSKLALTFEGARKLESETRGQTQNDKWQSERRSRITASNFGRFMQRKAPVTDKFLQSVLVPKAFTSNATSYGTNSEKVALNMYRKKTGNHVHECGLVVNPGFPFLGASPDGKVCEQGLSGLLEIKCPFSIRDWNIVDALKSYEKKQMLCLELNDNGEVSLKKSHQYWYQVQGQLLVTGASFCDFLVYTRIDLVVTRILPDSETFRRILDRLGDVYCNYIAK